MTIHRINETLYAVESESTDRSYTVNVQAQSCSCPDATFRNRACKHVAAVQEFAAAMPQPTAYEKAMEKARKLSTEKLTSSLDLYPDGPVAGAIRIELARRKLAEQRQSALRAVFA